MRLIQHWVEERALWGLTWWFRVLPRNLSLRLGYALGLLVYRLGIRTQVTRQNLTQAFPEWGPVQVNRTARKCYRHFGALLVEFARLPLLNLRNVDELVDLQGLEIFNRCSELGKGGVVVSGHLGNWELMGAAVSVLGYPVSYVVTGQTNERVERLMDGFRRSAGVQIIKRREAIKGVLKALRENGLVAILSDQDAHEAGAFVPFFGRPTSTPRGAATFCLRVGTSLIFADSYRQDLGKLKVVLEFVSQDNLPASREAAVDELTRRFTQRLEQSIRRRPEQWFWMHRRWKTKSPGDTSSPQ